MAPDLNDSYTKDLSRKPDCIKEEIVGKFYHLSKGGDLLEVTEYLLRCLIPATAKVKSSSI